MVLDMIFVLFLIFIGNIIFYFIIYITYKIRNYNAEIIFYQDYLEAKYKKGNKKIFYKNIETIIVERNLLGSRNILVNYPVIYGYSNVFNNLRKDERYNITLNNVENYEEIIVELIEKTRFDKFSKNQKELERKFPILSLYTVIYIIVLFGFFYKIKYIFTILPLAWIKLFKKNYKFDENSEAIKIYNKRRIIYLKRGNYILENDKLILKIRKKDTLFENEVFIVKKIGKTS
ncbi:hypothetical protein HMPREF0554_2188 [Pseudoleptotrichia goodfellowii F0264]|uniref:DUF304 domain-containing protein n=1 Tax=Pseudoleptotrichia goodfellowii F0264 TaxID=596323 RepID=D0GKR9_9FUSO|nr:hypothetical protein HMPREF0554_2188 [Pseudoleptotrichia goodfellowii F0264]